MMKLWLLALLVAALVLQVRSQPGKLPEAPSEISFTLVTSLSFKRPVFRDRLSLESQAIAATQFAIANQLCRHKTASRVAVTNIGSCKWPD